MQTMSRLSVGFFVASMVAKFFESNGDAKNIKHIFVFVLYSKHHINKIFSGSLLIVLLFVHSVKLLHSHPYNQGFHNISGKEISFNKIISNDNSKFSSECEICSYQITKDTDDAFSFIEYDCKVDQLSFFNQDICSGLQIFCSTSESRGPPLIAL